MLQKRFKEPHKFDDKFGIPRSYGLHSGVDENGIAGGNTDCGYKLYPIHKSANIVFASEAKTGYGNIVVYEIKGPWGTRWIRYCHCQKILVRSGLVSPDTPIALLGTTGNSTGCHLHWDVIKKPLSNWRIYAKDQATLDEYFENPLDFLAQWETVEETNMLQQWLLTMFLELGIDLRLTEQQIRPKVQEIIDAFRKRKEYENRIKQLEKDYAGAAGEAAENETRLSICEQNRGKDKTDLDEERRKVARRDGEIATLTKKLEAYEGKVMLTEEEYKKLTANKVLDRHTAWELIKELFSRFFKGVRLKK
ncbi:MAG: peptidoglycan DD-metalloendopeptidase family protein [Candidatus Riesia sp.]|nr:peptidoglycan DD-metalloendopeptidase family protein [Candidatus Riesia sp.]